jgi:GNAT superfamily N-acetyltransferase
MNIEVVRAEEKHVNAIGQLWWEFMDVHKKVEPIFTPRDDAIPDFQDNHVHRLMKSEDGLVLVALNETNVVGFSSSEILKPPAGAKREKYGYIDLMAVTADYRRKGIGAKMYGEILQWFKLKNIDRVEVQTTAKNLMANSFWQKQGFHRLSAQPV